MLYEADNKTTVQHLYDDFRWLGTTFYSHRSQLFYDDTLETMELEQEIVKKMLIGLDDKYS